MTQYTEFPGPPGYNVFQPNGINDSGVIVGVAGNQGPSQGFVYRDGIYTLFNDPSAGTGANQYTDPTAINDLGDITGIYFGGDGIGHAFLYSGSTFETLSNPSGYSAFQPNGINNAGVIVGVAGNQAPSQGFIYSNGVYTAFNDPSAGSKPGQYTLPTAVNDSGDITGIYTDDNGVAHAFIYSGGVFTTLPNPPGFDVFQPKGISDSGLIVGVAGNQGPSQGFIYSDGVYTPYNDPASGSGPGQYTLPTSVSGRGEILETYTDGNGITHQSVATLESEIPCFWHGTLILTSEGEVPIQDLKVGDAVVTVDGRESTVRWLGRRTVSKLFAEPLRALPVRIKTGAISDNVPSRDLLLSPDHAIFIDDVLLQAGALVNGTSVLRENNVPHMFTYYHIELDDHSLIFAENTPAETFIDNIGRLSFDNWTEHKNLHQGAEPISEMSYPRAKARRQVPHSIRNLLARRSAEFFEGDASAA
jgi:probable HAF family extracellular repeat protein